MLEGRTGLDLAVEGAREGGDEVHREAVAVLEHLCVNCGHLVSESTLDAPIAGVAQVAGLPRT